MSQTVLLNWNFKIQKDLCPMDSWRQNMRSLCPGAQFQFQTHSLYLPHLPTPLEQLMGANQRPKTSQFPKPEPPAVVPAPDCSLQWYLLGQLQFLFQILELVPIFCHFYVGCAQFFLQCFHLWIFSLGGEECTR